MAQQTPESFSDQRTCPRCGETFDADCDYCPECGPPEEWDDEQVTTKATLPPDHPAVKLVTLTTFATPIEAQLACNHLEAEGVAAFLAEEHMSNTLWSTLGGGVKLQVAEMDLELAAEILGRKQPLPPPVSPPSAGIAETRTCPECGQPFPAGLDQCPECQPSDEDEAGGALHTIAQTDALVSRAFRAAVLGLFVCPPLLHVYVLWLLLRLVSFPGELSPQSLRKLWITIIIEAIVFGAVALIFSQVRW